MDSWTDVQLATMRYGGNANALAFFNKYGIADIPNLTNKYGSAAGQAYREKLAALSTGQPWKDPAKDDLKKFRAYARPSESMYRDSDNHALEKFLLPKGQQPQRAIVQKPAPKPADDDFFNFTTSEDANTNDNGVDELNTSTSSSTAPSSRTNSAPSSRTNSNAPSPTVPRNANGAPRGGAKVRGRGKGRGTLVRKPQPAQAKPVEETFTTEEYDEIWGFSTEGLDAATLETPGESEIKSDNLGSTLSETTSESIVAI